MPPDDAPHDEPLAGGDFSSWLAGTRRALQGDGDADVPCAGCTACCTSSQFVHIAPDEVDTLAHIPNELLFPAPLAPPGHVLMGYDERGHCPMLVDNVCSIYEHRPRTCRTYDCRVFPATGVEVTEPEKEAIARRARRWVFTYATPADRLQHASLRDTASRLADERPDLPPTARAIAALVDRARDDVHDNCNDDRAEEIRE